MEASELRSVARGVWVVRSLTRRTSALPWAIKFSAQECSWGTAGWQGARSFGQGLLGMPSDACVVCVFQTSLLAQLKIWEFSKREVRICERQACEFVREATALSVRPSIRVLTHFWQWVLRQQTDSHGMSRLPMGPSNASNSHWGSF